MTTFKDEHGPERATPKICKDCGWEMAECLRASNGSVVFRCSSCGGVVLVQPPCSECTERAREPRVSEDIARVAAKMAKGYGKAAAALIAEELRLSAVGLEEPEEQP
jgi:hypothetical protein